MAPVLERKINWFRPKKSAKRRAPDLENQESSSSGLGPMFSPNSRIQFASNQSKLVLRKLDPGHWSKVGIISLINIIKNLIK
jgi:hypothetical protein